MVSNLTGVSGGGGVSLFGAPLPHNSVEWLAMLISFWASLGTVQVALTAFIDHHLGRPVKLRLSGYILPLGWVAWGSALIYAELGPLRVLIVLLGLLAMLVSAAELRRARDNAIPQPEGDSA